jgi:hypothetical protein
VLAVHQFRYLLAYGAHAGHELTVHGDTYVGLAVPLVIVALGVPVAAVLSRVARAWRGDGGAAVGRRPWWSLWLTATVLLVAGFVVLELLEIAVEPDHPPGLAGVLGDGGWWALPAAGIVAGLFTMLARGGRTLLRSLARWRHPQRPLVWHTPSRRTLGVDRRPARTPLAGCAAGRPPPIASPA